MNDLGSRRVGLRIVAALVLGAAVVVVAPTSIAFVKSVALQTSAEGDCDGDGLGGDTDTDNDGTCDKLDGDDDNDAVPDACDPHPRDTDELSRITDWVIYTVKGCAEDGAGLQ